MKEFNKVRHNMLKALVMIENSFKGHRELIMPFFKSIKAGLELFTFKLYQT